MGISVCVCVRVHLPSPKKHRELMQRTPSIFKFGPSTIYIFLVGFNVACFHKICEEHPQYANLGPIPRVGTDRQGAVRKGLIMRT